MNKKDNQRKKLFTPDTICIYILEAFPKFEKLSMSDYINSIIYNKFKPNLYILNYSYNKVISLINSIINGEDLNEADFISINNEIFNTLIYYEPIDYDDLLKIYTFNLKINFNLKIEQIKEKIGFYESYFKYLKNIDTTFDVSKKDVSYILSRIISNWDKVKYLIETYKILSSIFYYLYLFNNDVDFKVYSLLKILNTIDIALSNKNKGDYIKSIINNKEDKEKK